MPVNRNTDDTPQTTSANTDGTHEPDGVFSKDVPELLQRHFDELHEGSGLSVEVIEERRYRSILGKKELTDAGFAKAQRRVPGLFIPVHTTDGQVLDACYKPDIPRLVRGKILKYEIPKGGTVRLDVPPRCREKIGDPAEPLWFTEGIKKGDALAALGLTVCTLLGVWNFKSKNEFGGVTLMADFDHVALNGRTVNIVFDSDVMRIPTVRKALDRLKEHLQRKGSVVNEIYLPEGDDGEKVGVDDYLLNHTIDDLQKLVQEPPPVLKAAAPSFELLDTAPPEVRTPLTFVDGHTFATTWLYVKVSRPESLDKEGKIVRHDPPITSISRELFVIKDDGTVFGPGASKSLDDIGFEVTIENPPMDSQLLSKAGVLTYAKGTRPDPADVFTRMASVFDRYLDFSRSIAGQPEMCELSALLTLQTWFQPVFTVMGYAWPNGDRGTGKTKWGTIWASMGYLGEMILASTTLAVLRDCAEYGASMMFDDAENLADPRKSDPDKRALLLAGNRLGATIGLKEPDSSGSGKWVTRRVNAYCPRAFTATRLPDPILASRSIVIPLARTNNAYKGNADPVKVESWPCDRRKLLDDLWAMSLSTMSEAKAVWNELDNEEDNIGREFEPWRGVIALARLLERHGQAGLELRMRDVMAAYKEERSDLDTGDRASQVLRAILQIQVDERKVTVVTVKTVVTVSSEGKGDVKVNSTMIRDALNRLSEGEGFDSEWASSRRIGWQLRALRFQAERAPDSRKRTRMRTMPMTDFLNLCEAYGVLDHGSVHFNSFDTPLPLGQNGHNVLNGHNGHSESEPEPSDNENAEAQQGELPLENQESRNTELRI